MAVVVFPTPPFWLAIAMIRLKEVGEPQEAGSFQQALHF